jgi:hypothetical protein
MAPPAAGGCKLQGAVAGSPAQLPPLLTAATRDCPQTTRGKSLVLKTGVTLKDGAVSSLSAVVDPGHPGSSGISRDGTGSLVHGTGVPILFPSRNKDRRGRGRCPARPDAQTCQFPGIDPQRRPSRRRLGYLHSVVRHLPAAQVGFIVSAVEGEAAVKPVNWPARPSPGRKARECHRPSAGRPTAVGCRAGCWRKARPCAAEVQAPLPPRC